MTLLPAALGSAGSFYVFKLMKKIIFSQHHSWLRRNPALAGLLFSLFSFAWVKTLSEVKEFSASFWLVLALVYGALALLAQPSKKAAKRAPGASSVRLIVRLSPLTRWRVSALAVLLVAWESWFYSHVPLGIAVASSRGVSIFVLAFVGMWAFSAIGLNGFYAVLGMWLMLPLPLPGHNPIQGDEAQLAVLVTSLFLVIGHFFQLLQQESYVLDGINVLQQWRDLAPRQAVLGFGAALVYGFASGNWGSSQHDLALAALAAVAYAAASVLAQYPRRSINGRYCGGFAPLGVLIQDAYTVGVGPWWRYLGLVIFMFCAFLIAQNTGDLNRGDNAE